jgi:WD40 repeat protein
MRWVRVETVRAVERDCNSFGAGAYYSKTRSRSWRNVTPSLDGLRARTCVLARVLSGVVATALLLATSHGSLAQVALEGHTDDVVFVAFMPDGKTLMSGSEDGSIRLWDAEEGRERGFWQKTSPFDGTAASTRILSLSGDGSLLARAGGPQGTVELWDVAKAVRLRSLKAHQGVVDGVVLSADASLLVTFSRDEFKIWQVAAGKQMMAKAAPSQYAIRAAGVTADGKIVAVATSDKVISFYDPTTAKSIRSFDSGPLYVHALAFSPDAGLLASAGDGDPSENLHVWKVADGTAVPGPFGPPQAAHSVAFSSDGRLLAAGGLTVAVWDLAAGKLAFTFDGHSGPVRSLSFSPDGRFLASAGEDNVVGLWKLGAHD